MPHTADVARSAPRSNPNSKTTGNAQGAGAVTPAALRLNAACQYTGMSRSTMNRAVSAGLLPKLKMGNATAFRVSDLNALLERAAQPGGVVLREYGR